MTEQDLTQVQMMPRVQYVGQAGDREWLWSDLATAMEIDDDPATVSDDRMIALVADMMDVPVANLGDVKVTRPEVGNILVSPTPVFGQ